MKKIFLSVLSGLLLILDLFTKSWVQSNIRLGGEITVIDNFFEITYHQNTGAAWSFGEGGAMRPVFLGISLIVSIYIVYAWLKEKDTLMLGAFALIFAGNMGNFYDRLTLGYVRDMLSFNIFGYAFPVFNIADMCLVIGFGLVLFQMFIEERRVKLHG